MLFHQRFMNIDNITSINNVIINGKIVDIHLMLFFSLAVKSFEVFPKHNGYGFISELFALD